MVIMSIELLNCKINPTLEILDKLSAEYEKKFLKEFINN